MDRIRLLCTGWIRRRRERTERVGLVPSSLAGHGSGVANRAAGNGYGGILLWGDALDHGEIQFLLHYCYLSEEANYARPQPFPEVRAQLDALRAELGPGGKVQITSGEVTLLVSEKLGRIVAYAREIGLA